MKFLFRNDAYLFKMEVSNCIFVLDPWMGLRLGEGEKEIANHGRSRVKSFSQETVDKAQQRPRNGAHGQIRVKCRMHEILGLNSPFFSFSMENLNG